MPFRFDTTLVEDSKIKRSPSGGARVDALLTQPGVFPYTGVDGKVVREYRPPEEVFNADSMASLDTAAVTNRHPRVPVDSNNWRALAIGVVSSPRKDDSGPVPGVAAAVVVQDAAAVSKLGTDLREVSCGYEVRLDMTPGITPGGEHYDCVQRDIRYNHVGLGPAGWGRQGPNSALRLDSAGDQAFDDAPEREEKKTMKIRHDGVDFEAATEAELQAKIDAHDAAKGANADKARADELAGQVAVLTTQLATERTRADSAPAAATAAVRARIELEASAAKVLGATFKADGADGKPKSDREIRIEAIRTFEPTFKADGESDDFVRGVYSQWVNSPAGGAARRDSLALGLSLPAVLPVDPKTVKNDGLDREAPSAEAARAKMVSGYSDAIKRPGDFHK